MKKYLLKVLLLSVFIVPFVSCSDDDDEPETGFTLPSTGIYVLNTGVMNANNAKLAFYDTEKGEVISDVFGKANDGLPLGDIAQDIAVYGSKVYTTVTNSNKLFVTDRGSKLQKTFSPLNESSQPLKPRSIATHKGKVYVSTEAGYVMRIDTTNMNMDMVKVGAFSEEMTIVNEKLYVTNSRSNSKIVSVVDLNNFTGQATEITVADNPSIINSDKYGNIYVIAWGIWGSTPSTFCKINSTTNAVTEIGTDVASMMAVLDDKVLLMKLDYSTTPASSTFLYYNIKTETLVNEPFITDGTTISAGYSLTVDQNTKNIYIGTGDSNNLGKMYLFSSDGKLKEQFSTEGYYPIKGTYITPSK
ncbi:MAG: hypothetical protein E6767_16070 [Dysgonomonas sp.]|nr:hypothetical protein [Dysgonomonas sp.]